MFDPATTALALAIALVAVPLLTAPVERRFLRSNPGTAGKLAYYGITIAGLWALTFAAVWIFGVERLVVAPWPWRDWLPYASTAGLIVGVVVAGYFVLGLMPLLQSLRGTRWRRAYAKAYRKHAEGFLGLLPETGVERFSFVLLSLTAGICEETLFRGFLIRYLHEGAFALPLLTALALSSVAFGLAHIYQGASAVLRTGLVGLAFGLLYLLTGSLIPCIALHALIDLQGAYFLRPLPDEDMAAAA